MKLKDLLSVCDYNLFEIVYLDSCYKFPEKKVFGSSLFVKKNIPSKILNYKIHSFTVDEIGFINIKLLI